MTLAIAVVALVATVLTVTELARRLDVSAPLLLTIVGVGASFLPFVPPLVVSPELVLVGLLPPLLYAASVKTSLVDLGANRRNIGMLSVGLVAFSAIGVGLALWWLFDVPLPLGIAVGGVVAPPDAVAATAVGRRIGLPRRIVTVLEGESLFNDATALVLVRLGILALGSALSVGAVVGQVAWTSIGGVGIGLVVAQVLTWVRRRVTDPISGTAISFLAPWLAYLPAEELHASGVLAVVVAGVLLGHRAPVIQSATSRVADRINWATAQFILENGVFLLIGLQAKGIIERITATPAGVSRALLMSLVVLAAVVVLRPLWVIPLRFLMGDPQDRRDQLRSSVIVSWAGMRGVVTLAAAFTLPVGVPDRDAFVLAALVVVAGTLLVQGSSLPWVARRLDVHGPDPREDVLQTATVMRSAVTAGLRELDRLAAPTEPPLPDGLVDQLRTMAERRVHAVWEQLGAPSGTERPDGSGGAIVETPSESYRRARTAMLQAERTEVLRLRDLGTIDHEVLAAVLASLDVEESVVTSVSERQGALRERLVLTPESSKGDCLHLRDAPVGIEPVTPDGCADCLRDGTTWVHLRLCLTCGNVGCCDSSTGRHATAHHRQTAHPVMRSIEPGEGWRWCYVDELLG